MGLLSDRHRGWKVAGLLLIIAGLTVYSALGFKSIPPQWVRAAQWRTDFAAHRNERVWLNLVKVEGRSADGRTVIVTVGRRRIPLTLKMPVATPLHRVMDVDGRLIGPATIRVEKVRFLQGNHTLKVYISLAAAMMVGLMFFAVFRFGPRRAALFRLRRPGRDKG